MEGGGGGTPHTGDVHRVGQTQKTECHTRCSTAQQSARSPASNRRTAGPAVRHRAVTRTPGRGAGRKDRQQRSATRAAAFCRAQPVGWPMTSHPYPCPRSVARRGTALACLFAQPFAGLYFRRPLAPRRQASRPRPAREEPPGLHSRRHGRGDSLSTRAIDDSTLGTQAIPLPARRTTIPPGACGCSTRRAGVGPLKH